MARLKLFHLRSMKLKMIKTGRFLKLNFHLD